MNTSATASPVEIVHAAYAAFGRGDIPAILGLLADEVDWRFIGARGLPYTGSFRSCDEIAGWFRTIAEVDEILVFEPREFIAGGEHVTVIGFERTQALPSGRESETDWVHVFGMRDGRIARYLGIYDTQASAQARA